MISNTFDLVYDQEAVRNWLDDVIAIFKGSKVDMNLVGRGVFFDNCELLRIKETLVECKKKKLVNIVFLDKDEIKKGLKDVAKLNSPKIFFLEGGDWIEGEKPSDEEKAIRDFVYDAFEKIKNKEVVICVNTKCYMSTPEKFRSVGYFDRFVGWTKPKMESVAEEFIALTGKEILDSELIADKKKLGAILFQNGRDKLRLMRGFSLACRRKAQRNEERILKSVEFFELLQGTVEGQPNFNKVYFEEVATHETGHALVAMVESNFEAIPEFISISQTGNYLGIMLDNSLFDQTNIIRSYEGSIREIKVFLAGRAAEELFIGKPNVGIEGASHDLYYASARAIKLVQNGFLHDYLEKGNVGEELFIPSNWDGEKNYTWAESEARKIMARCYREVLETLRKNKDLFSRLKKRLMKEKMLTEKDLLEIIKKDSLPSMERIYAN